MSPAPPPAAATPSGRPGLRCRVENSLSIAVLAAMCLLPVLEVGSRLFRGRSIAGTIPLVEHLTLWIAFLGAALAARSGRHLALSTTSFLPERHRPAVRIGTNGLAAGLAAWLLWGSLDLIQVEREAVSEVAMGIPVWIAMCIMPAGLASVSLRFLFRASETWKGRALAMTGFLLPMVLAMVPALQGSGILVPALGLVLAATFLGMPIFTAIGGAALLLFWNEGIPVAAVPVEAYRLTAHPMLPAVPLFTLGGYILSEGGASRRLMRLLTSLFGWMPGGLAIVTTFVLAFFTPLTGASGVTILSMGGLLLPVLVRARYPEKSSIGLVTVSGSIGLLLPPSLPVILYAVTSNLSIADLFLAGLIPGLLLIFLVAGWGARQGVLAKVERTPFRFQEAAAAVWGAKWELLLPVIVLVGIFGGFATLVETAALTVAYALIIGCIVHRDLSLRRDVGRITVECATMLGGFLIILGMALGLTNYLIDAEIPMRALSFVQEHIESPLVFLLVLNLFLLVVGGLMDIYSAIFVVVPLIVPMGLAYGIDPVHLGIIFLTNLELGYLTPPMGENLFLSSYRFNRPLTYLFQSTLPYWLLLLGAVLIITYVPSVSLFLVRWLGN
ncbi:MAG: TRAP transporter large permease subunit [Acidobacteriota bacterium]